MIRRFQKLSKYLGELWLSKELYVFLFFCFLFLVLILRLFYLQIVMHTYYEDYLNQQHVSQSLLEAKRGQIFALDKSGQPVQLTENITMYNVFVDPKFIWDKQQFIDIITPVIYSHMCIEYGMKKIGKIDCIKNIEKYANKELLPKIPEFFYFGSGIVSPWYTTFDWTGYYTQLDAVLQSFTTGTAQSLIKSKLEQRIQVGIKTRNYIWFFANAQFISELKALALPYIDVQYDNYVYILPAQVRNAVRDAVPLRNILMKYGYTVDETNFLKSFAYQENRYVKLISDANPSIAKMIKDLKLKYYQERTADNVPVLHWLWLESYTKRYYPYQAFLSNVLWYVDKNGTAFYGIEQYFDELLRGKNGKIIGRASAWIWQVGANEFEIEDVKNGDHMYLTVDIGIQKEIENIAKKWQATIKSDSVSILVYDPMNGQIKASTNAPSFDPNSYDDVYTMVPLGTEQSYVIDNDTYVDVPVYIKTGGEMVLAKTAERLDTTIPKYIAKNMYGPQVFVDKNISMAYEPGSIFKIFTVGAWVDTDEISFYDFYNDPGEVKVGPYTIKNADNKNCMGDHSFMNALVYSCNVGMVRVVQKVGKNNFYNYVEKLGFGKLTDVELAGEDEWEVESVTTVSMARFLNNAFGQGLLTTPLQIAAAYGSIVNWWYYVKPTIIAGIRDNVTGQYRENKKKVIKQIFRPETVKEIQNALYHIVESNKDYIRNVRIEWYKLWGKSWTSQISYKGKYMQGIGWTNGSFVGLITTDNPKYIVVVQIRRPRSSVWWGETAGVVFHDVAKFLIGYSFLEK